MAETWMTSQETADLIRVHPATLAAWRMKQQGPAFSRVSRNAVRYNRADVEAWLEASRVATDGGNR